MDVQLQDFHKEAAEVQQFWSQLRSAKHAEEWNAAQSAKQGALRDLAQVEATLNEERSKKRAKLSEYQMQMEHIARESADATDDKKRKLEHISTAIAAEEDEIKEGIAAVSKRMKLVSEKENDAKKMRCKLGLQHHFTNIIFHRSDGDVIEGNVSNPENRDLQLFEIPSRSHTVASADRLWDLIRT